MTENAVDDYREFLSRIHSKIHNGRFVGLNVNRYTINNLRDDFTKHRRMLTAREEQQLRDIEEAYERTAEAKEKKA
ncbi:MAG: hypothetical protein L0213_12650 [Candidatus Dadabacteria bacterium]|nr:hypothetical protein [Candidatus Dadabacteria bacterium]